MLLRSETADPAYVGSNETSVGWHFSGDAVRFLQGAE